MHFNAVTERFYPHDTTFSITSSKELKDSTLSAACSLHTASGSTSSSTSSLRRRRLMEITEDEEEDNRAKRQSTVPEDRATIPKPFVPLVLEPPPLVISVPESLPSGLPPSSTDYRAMIADLETSPPPPREPAILEVIRPTSPTRSIEERRKSSQSTRPDLSQYSSYGSNGRPKIKLGPRPSLDVGGRSNTSASSPASHFRPVSSLPAGLKLAKTPSKRDKDRPHTQGTHSTEPHSMTISISPPPIPENSTFVSQLRPHTSGGRPTTSSGVSIRPPPSPSAMSAKFPFMTPEKARLMKALDLRKKKSQAAAEELAIPKEELLQTSLPSLEDRPVSAAPSKEVQNTLQMLTDMAETPESGVHFDARSALKTDESDATRSDSNPVSPIGASEKAESTRASSISGSTDETIQEPVAAKTATPTPEPEVEEEKPLSLGVEPEEEKDEVAPPTVEDKKEDLYMLLPYTYTPPIRTPNSEKKEFIEEAVPANYRLPPSGVSQQKQADLTLLEDNEPEASQPEVATLQEQSVDTSKDDETVDQATQDEVTPPAVPVKQWKIPRSKFSSQSLKADAQAPAIPTQALPLNSVERSNEHAMGTPLDHTTSNGGSSSISVKKTRRVKVDPIRTEGLTDHSNSDAHFSSDEELMDELQSAVMQEAMPMSVTSPTSSAFPSPNKNKGNRFSRTFSNPLRKDKDDSQLLGSSKPPQQDKRSVSASAAYLNKINQNESRPVAKKVNLGSGISQRIKALEKLSSAKQAATLTNANLAPSGPNTTFFSNRKGSVREPSSTPSVADRANSLSRNNTPPHSESRDSSPDVRNRSGSVQSRMDAFRSSPTPLAKSQRVTTESISVTARILRDPSQPFSGKPDFGKDVTDFKPLDLKESPLEISHQKAGMDAPKETIQERRLSRESTSSVPKKERRSSITVFKDFISEGRTSMSERRRSMNLETSTSKSPSKSPSRPPSTHTTRPMSIGSRLSISSRDMSAPSPPLTARSSSSNSEDKPEKKASRASRMLNRMSNSLTSSRKAVSHAMSPTVREESEPPNFQDSPFLSSSQPSQITMAPVPTLNKLGEVNVQFPDSLLWKRRSMALDSQGNLILTAIGNGKETKGGAAASRRFHFSEFRVPAIPDIEMQELPNSVVLDFVEGGGLQIACEDRAGQGSLLKGAFLLFE